jgi:hypothetical protein
MQGSSMTETRRHTAPSIGPLGELFDQAVAKTHFWWLPPLAGIPWIVLAVVILRFNDATVCR